MHDDTSLLIDVCSIDSIWGKERELAEFLAVQLTAWECDDVELVESRPNRPSVGARLRGSGGGRSLVSGFLRKSREKSAGPDYFVPRITRGRLPPP